MRHWMKYSKAGNDKSGSRFRDPPTKRQGSVSRSRFFRFCPCYGVFSPGRLQTAKPSLEIKVPFRGSVAHAKIE